MGLFGKKSATATGFNSSSTAEEVTDGIDASQLTAIVTGGTSGIGKVTVRVLAKRGAHVVIAARNVESAGTVKEEVLKETPGANVDIIKLDTSSLESVRAAAKEFLAVNLPLNILVNNAGIFQLGPLQKSVDGTELHFATNYLGHFLFTNLLLDKLKDTAKESGIEGRIVNVSSRVHCDSSYKEGIRFENLNDTKGYQTSKAYGHSKLAQVLTTKELAKHLQEEGANVTVNCLHPGLVNTNIGGGHILVTMVNAVLGIFGMVKTVEQGAATQCYLALNSGAKGVSGKYYFDDVNERPSPSKFANDDELAKKLWDFSLDLTAS